jgi:hypothetical protein
MYSFRAHDSRCAVADLASEVAQLVINWATAHIGGPQMKSHFEDEQLWCLLARGTRKWS